MFYNQGAVTYKGAEAQVTYALPKGFAVFANGSRNYAKTDNPGAPQQQVAKAPEWTAAGGLLYKYGPLRFSAIDKWVGHQWFLAPPGVTGANYDNPTYQSNGYNTAIVSARYELKRIRFGVEVSNLFNSTKVTSISQGKRRHRSGQQGAGLSVRPIYLPGRPRLHRRYNDQPVMLARLLLLSPLALALVAAGPKPEGLLTQADLDPALVLPPPPVAGSDQARAELAELLAIEKRRTVLEAMAAREEGQTKDASIFASAIGPGFDLERLPATARLMKIVRASEKGVVSRGKDQFRRPRPWVRRSDDRHMQARRE